MDPPGDRDAGTAGGSKPVVEAPALLAGLDDLAMMGEPVEQGSGHLGVAEDTRSFAEGQVGDDDDRGSLVEPAQQVEEQLAELPVARAADSRACERALKAAKAAGRQACGAAPGGVSEHHDTMLGRATSGEGRIRL